MYHIQQVLEVRTGAVGMCGMCGGIKSYASDERHRDRSMDFGCRAGRETGYTAERRCLKTHMVLPTSAVVEVWR